MATVVFTDNLQINDEIRTAMEYIPFHEQLPRLNRKPINKGYYVPNGYMGYVNGRYELFATEADYLEREV